MSATIHHLPTRHPPRAGLPLADAVTLHRVAEIARAESEGATDPKVAMAVASLAVACDAWADGRVFEMCEAFDEFAEHWMGRVR